MNKKIILVLSILLMSSLALAFTPLEGITTSLLGISGKSFDSGRMGVDAGCSLTTAENYCLQYEKAFPTQAWSIYRKLAVGCDGRGGYAYAVDSSAPPTYAYYKNCPSNPTNPCTSHASYTCYNMMQDIYWKDSCGNWEERKQECADAGCASGSSVCSAATCVKATKTNYAYIGCYANNPYYYNGCYERGDQAGTCTSTQTCVSGVCREITTTAITLSDISFPSAPVITYINPTTAEVTVTQKVTAAKSGRALLEASIDFQDRIQPSRETSATIRINYCDSSRRWIASNLVDLTQGDNYITYTLIPHYTAGAFSNIAWGEKIRVSTTAILGGCGSSTRKTNSLKSEIKTLPLNNNPIPKLCYVCENNNWMIKEISNPTTCIEQKPTTPCVTEPVTAPETCTGQVCQGDEAVTVTYSPEGDAIFTSATTASFSLLGREGSADTCDMILKDDGKIYTTLTNNIACANNRIVIPSEDFKPKIINVKVYDENTKKWVSITGSSIPSEVTKNWAPGKTIKMRYTIDNSAAKNYDLSIFDKIGGGLKKFSDTLIKVNCLLFHPLCKSSSDADKLVLSSSQSKAVISPAALEGLNALPGIHAVVTEAAIYSSAAGTKAYDYSRALSYRTSVLPTISPTDSCQTGEDDQGWIKTNLIILQTRIGNNCRTTTNPAVNILGYTFPGACKMELEAELKIPDEGDKIADGTSNFDSKGQYYLHAAVFDQCWRPDRDINIVNTKTDFTITIPEEYEPGKICCQHGGLAGIFTTKELLSRADCEAEGGKQIDMSICGPEVPCYNCDEFKGEVITGTATSVEECDNRKGWTSSLSEAESRCEKHKPCTQGCSVDCFQCNADNSGYEFVKTLTVKYSMEKPYELCGAENLMVEEMAAESCKKGGDCLGEEKQTEMCNDGRERISVQCINGIWGPYLDPCKGICAKCVEPETCNADTRQCELVKCDYVEDCPVGTAFCGTDGLCYKELPKTNCDGDKVVGLGGRCYSEDNPSWLFAGDRDAFTAQCISGLCRDAKSNPQGVGVCVEMGCEVDITGPTYYCDVNKGGLTKCLDPLGSCSFISEYYDHDQVLGAYKVDITEWETAAECAQIESVTPKCLDDEYWFGDTCHSKKESVTEGELSLLKIDSDQLIDENELIDETNPVCFSDTMCSDDRCIKADKGASGLPGTIYNKIDAAVDEKEANQFLTENPELKRLGMRKKTDAIESYGVCIVSGPLDICKIIGQLNIFGMSDACLGGGLVIGGILLIIILIYSSQNKPKQQQFIPRMRWKK